MSRSYLSLKATESRWVRQFLAALVRFAALDYQIVAWFVAGGATHTKKFDIRAMDLPKWNQLATGEYTMGETYSGVRTLVKSFSSREEASSVFRSLSSYDSEHCLLLSSTHLAIRYAGASDFNVSEIFSQSQTRLQVSPEAIKSLVRLFSYAANMSYRHIRNLPRELCDQILSHLSDLELIRLEEKVPELWPNIFFHRGLEFGNNTLDSCSQGELTVRGVSPPHKLTRLQYAHRPQFDSFKLFFGRKFTGVAYEPSFNDEITDEESIGDENNE